jgi:arabinofuranan 3-O-arabinosyltransferase
MPQAAKTFLRFLVQPGSRYVLAWVLAMGCAGSGFVGAWRAFDSERHADGTPVRRGGNNGHAMVDFGGQWLLARMLAVGLGHHLYDRNYQWGVVQEAYPIADEAPEEERPAEGQGHHEADDLMSWMMGEDDHYAARQSAGALTPLAAGNPVGAAAYATASAQQGKPTTSAGPSLGGPLYPPIQAMLMSPLGFLRPATAYRVVQIVSIALAFFMGGALVLLSQGRIWWPMATAALVLYPGFCSTLALGQNTIVTLALLFAGWTLIARERPILAGIVWGFLAFKPVWAAAFFLVPLLTRRWRVCFAMLGTGIALAVATLPLVGWHVWLDWLQIGRDASWLYSVDENWVFLSRDLLNIPSRWLLNFDADLQERGSRLATLLGWALLLAVVGATALFAWRRRGQARAVTGPIAAFLLLGAWLSCFHFMYYEVLLSAVAVLLLFTEPAQYVRPMVFAQLPARSESLNEELLDYHTAHLLCSRPPVLRFLAGATRNVAVVNSVVLTLLALLVIVEVVFPGLALTASVAAPHLKTEIVPTPLRFSTSIPGTPFSTFCLLALWLWCGVLWLRTYPREQNDSAGVQTI